MDKPEHKPQKMIKRHIPCYLAFRLYLYKITQDSKIFS